MNRKLSSAEWSRYWQKGSITTFFGAFPANYDGEVRRFWRDALTPLADGAQILDLGTGNGALAALAAELALEAHRKYLIAAVDFAEIDPTGRVRAAQRPEVLAQIEFREKTPMEDTRIASSSIDCVISQFGFEYGARSRVIEELMRVLKPNARIALMVHHQSSELLQQAREGLAQFGVCEKSKLLPLVAALCRELESLREQARRSSAESENLRAQINSTAGFLENQHDNFRDPYHLQFYLRNAVAVFGKPFAGKSLADKLGFLEQVNQESQAYRARMSDLVAAGLSDQAVGELERSFEDMGFEIRQSAPVEYKQRSFGYGIIADRQAT